MACVLPPFRKSLLFSLSSLSRAGGSLGAPMPTLYIWLLTLSSLSRSPVCNSSSVKVLTFPEDVLRMAEEPLQFAIG